MKILIGILLAFTIGGACRFFDIPVPSPPMLPGALLVLATTLGYTSVDRLLTGRKPTAAVSQRVTPASVQHALVRSPAVDSRQPVDVKR
jgi:XapX domain-containing protein